MFVVCVSTGTARPSRAVGPTPLRALECLVSLLNPSCLLTVTRHVNQTLTIGSELDGECRQSRPRTAADGPVYFGTGRENVQIVLKLKLVRIMRELYAYIYRSTSSTKSRVTRVYLWYVRTELGPCALLVCASSVRTSILIFLAAAVPGVHEYVLLYTTICTAYEISTYVELSRRLGSNFAGLA